MIACAPVCRRYDVEAEHSRNLPSDPWDAEHGTGTTSYTGIAEVAPGVVMLAYDKSECSGNRASPHRIVASLPTST